LPWKTVAQKVSEIFEKTAQIKAIAQWVKIRPIWSPWSDAESAEIYLSKQWVNLSTFRVENFPRQRKRLIPKINKCRELNRVSLSENKLFFLKMVISAARPAANGRWMTDKINCHFSHENGQCDFWSAHTFLFDFLFVRLLVCLTTCLFDFLLVRLLVCTTTFLFNYFFVWLLFCLTTFLFDFLLVWLLFCTTTFLFNYFFVLNKFDKKMLWLKCLSLF
jgi:hypothetical protein